MSGEPPTPSRAMNYVIQLALALLITAIAGITATLQGHVGKIASIEQRATTLEHQFDRIESKLDHALRNHK